MWSELRFGKKHKGKTLPQVIFRDPDWFFWAWDKGVFKKNGSSLLSEAEDIYEKATSIKIPNNDSGALEVEYAIHEPTGKYAGLEIVPAESPRHGGATRTFRKKVIDMSVPRQIAKYDKRGGKLLVGHLKFLLFRSSSYHMTKKRCGEFFDNPDNFES